MPRRIIRHLPGVQRKRLVALLLEDSDVGNLGCSGLHQPAPLVKKATVQRALQIGVGGAAKLVQKQHQAIRPQAALDAVQIGDQLRGRLVGKDTWQRRAQIANARIGLQFVVNGVCHLKVEIVGGDIAKKLEVNKDQDK